MTRKFYWTAVRDGVRHRTMPRANTHPIRIRPDGMLSIIAIGGRGRLRSADRAYDSTRPRDAIGSVREGAAVMSGTVTIRLP